jgi:hypothetical protein
MNTWKCHKKTPCVVSCVATQNVIFFFSFSYTKSENRKVEQVLPGGIGTGGRGEEVGKW